MGWDLDGSSRGLVDCDLPHGLRSYIYILLCCTLACAMVHSATWRHPSASASASAAKREGFPTRIQASTAHMHEYQSTHAAEERMAIRSKLGPSQNPYRQLDHHRVSSLSLSSSKHADYVPICLPCLVKTQRMLTIWRIGIFPVGIPTSIITPPPQ
jgi:hypothetical protein